MLKTVQNYFGENKKRDKVIAISLIFTQILFFVFYQYIVPNQANAANFAYMRLDRLSASASLPLTGTICLQPQTAGAQSQIKVTFPASFTISGTAANWTVSTTNLPASTVAWPAIAAPSANASISGQIVTFIGNNLLSTSTTYCFNFSGGTAAQSNPGTTTGSVTGSIITYSPAQTPIDNANYAQSMLTPSNDQIAVTATVSATMTVTFSGNAITFPATGILTTASGSNGTPAITVTTSTNAHNGYQSWVKSANAGLKSPSTSGAINSAAYTTGGGNVVTLSGATTAYVLDGSTAGTGTVATEYIGSGTNGGNLDTKYESLYTSSAAAQSADPFTLTLRAKAGATTPAANDYSDTLTVSVAGEF